MIIIVDVSPILGEIGNIDPASDHGYLQRYIAEGGYGTGVCSHRVFSEGFTLQRFFRP